MPKNIDRRVHQVGGGGVAGEGHFKVEEENAQLYRFTRGPWSPIGAAVGRKKPGFRFKNTERNQ